MEFVKTADTLRERRKAALIFPAVRHRAGRKRSDTAAQKEAGRTEGDEYRPLPSPLCSRGLRRRASRGSGRTDSRGGPEHS